MLEISILEKLKESINNVADCGIITSDVNRRYVTGMKSSAGTLIIFSDEAYFVIDFRYIEKAQKLLANTGIQVVLQTNIWEQINSLVKKHNTKTIAVEADRCTIFDFEQYKKYLNAEIITDSRFSGIINELRITKTKEQIERITEAQRIAEKGFEHMQDFIRVGRTEREIQLELDYFILKNGAESLSFDTIALSGVNTSLPHGVPSDKKIEKGDFVLLDYGAVVDGYHSDMTRTICVGEPTVEMRNVYEIVLDAQKKALNAVKAGLKCSELDRIARDIIKNAGYSDYFGHSLGHGVGVEIHEAPTASPKSHEILQENSVVTIEPGIYLPGKFGVRIEDFVIVKKHGCINITKSPKELIIL